MDLNGKAAVVTGAANRIGRRLAIALAEAGCRVAIHYARSQDAARELVQALQDEGHEAVALGADFSAEPATMAERLIAQAREALGDVQILVNNAAIFEKANLAATDEDLFDRHLNINLKAPVFLSRAFADKLEGEAGHIVNIADWRGTRPQSEYLAYSLTKSGILALTQALARDLGPRIQVNAIAPGAILPPPGEDESYLQKIQDRNCLNRHGGPDDLAEAMLYFLRSSFVTGEVLHVNGGEHL